MKNLTDLIDALKKAKVKEVMNDKDFIAYAKNSTVDVLEAFLKASSLTSEYELSFPWK